jgi:hypothetical protein
LLRIPGYAAANREKCSPKRPQTAQTTHCAYNNRDYDEDTHEDDEKFYRETVYNEDYYLEQEQEMIRRSNLEFELERLEDEKIHEMREEGTRCVVEPG